MVIKDYAKKWLSRQLQDAKNGDKTEEYARMLISFYNNYWKILGGLEIREITTSDIQGFYDYLCQCTNSPGYRQLIMTTLKQFLGDARESEDLPMIRWPKIKKQNGNNKIPPTLTEDQQEEVIAKVPREHKAAVMLFFYHGLRPTEIRSLKHTDFSAEGDILTVKTAKGGPDRQIHIEPKLTGELFKTGFRLPQYTRSTFYKIVRKALNDAGFPYITPYQAGRHSAATNYLKRGASTRQVQYLMGHAKVTTTERYTHPEGLDQTKLRRK